MNCERCGHSERQHCKGGELHSDHKEDARMIPIKWRKNTVTCGTRHCEEPLCSCVEFVSAEISIASCA